MSSCERCFICGDSLSVGATVNVKEKGLNTLRKSSEERGDGNFEELKFLKTITVHVSCRKVYTHKDNIKAALKKLTDENTESEQSIPIKTKLRSSAPVFDFQTNCFYCGDRIDSAFHEHEKKKEISKRIKVHSVQSLYVKESVLDAARKRNDKWGQDVTKRVESVVDLVAAEAIYHGVCSVKFFKKPETGKKGGRPLVKDVTDAMKVIFDFIENTDECQFAMPDLINLLEGYVPAERTIKLKLLEKYGDDIIITTNKKKIPIVCFKNTGHKILSDHWYDNRNTNETEDRLRVVKAAAAIIREDIRTKIYDTSTYSSSDSFLNDINVCIPSTLDVFLENVIVKGRKCQKQPLERKCTAIAHAIITAVRPRSFLSGLLVSVATFLYRKYASKNLVTLLANLGFSASYNEAQLLEASVTLHPEAEIIPGTFCQFIFDNADFNISTVDGLNTFHSMGGIECVTPSTAVVPSPPIRRLKEMPKATNIGERGVMSIQSFEKIDGRGLRDIVIEDLPCLATSEEDIPVPALPDVLWMSGKFNEMAHIPGWRGFMDIITNVNKAERSRIICLPFVNSPPSNYDTIYTVLNLAVEKSKKVGIKTTFVTFDQPLYVKACDIVSAMGKDSHLANVVVRLGGFHLLMSFLGSIGFIMAGSGLKELMSVIYAPLSVEKMLTGHAYARAIRGHLLTQLALAKILFKDVDFTIAEHQAIQDMLRDFHFDPPILEQISEAPVIQVICEKVKSYLLKVEKNGPTAKLWIQYFNMVNLVKQYIHAERVGDWKGHLKTIEQMLPFFHASGHFPYAKACHMYLQDMVDLENNMDINEYRKFVNDGYFTIRRTEKFWTGTWSDMIIEQTLMRGMKVVGGLTSRGFTDSVLSKWTLAMPALHDICATLEEYCDLNFVSAEQHVDSRESRMERDDKDVKRLDSWLTCHDPFPISNRIVSISTGVVGDGSINCHNALEIGLKGIKEIVGNNFKDVKMKRANRVSPLATVNSGIKIYDTVVPIDPLMLFQRITIAKIDDDELVNYLEYELAPFPLSLFDERGMRKTKKSALYNLFEESLANVNFKECTHVIDGGYLLHRVVWHLNDSFKSICATYINYVKKHFGVKSVVVFDGYDNSATATKKTEQTRRSSRHMCADILFDETMAATVTQDKFLSNDKNKSRLIFMLTEKFENEGFVVKQATDDADTMIVTTAIDISVTDQVVIIGEDIDLLVLLIALAPEGRNIHFVKPGKGKTHRRMYCSRDLQSADGLRDRILFAHAFSGCDTTSCLYQKGKVTFFKLLRDRTDLHDAVRIFNAPDATHDDVTQAGQQFFLSVYGAPKTETSLNRHRYNSFTKSVHKRKSNLASLPPTAAAAQQHSFRVYHQVQKWRGCEMPPELWGWKKTDDFLKPIPTLQAPAPESLLKLISCNCKKGCTSSCGCKRAGLKCATICGYCHGTSCFNSNPAIEMEKESSVERDIDDDNVLDINYTIDDPDEAEICQAKKAAEITGDAIPSTSRAMLS